MPDVNSKITRKDATPAPKGRLFAGVAVKECRAKVRADG